MILVPQEQLSGGGKGRQKEKEKKKKKVGYEIVSSFSICAFFKQFLHTIS